jgi:hypothetical protein
LLGGGLGESEDGGGEPGRGEYAVEVAGALASPEDLLEPGGAGAGEGAAGRSAALVVNDEPDRRHPNVCGQYT